MDLYDADLATVSDLADHRRNSVTIDDAVGWFHASTITDYIWASLQRDTEAMDAAVAQAHRIDLMHPTTPSLAVQIDALHSTPAAA